VSWKKSQREKKGHVPSESKDTYANQQTSTMTNQPSKQFPVEHSLVTVVSLFHGCSVCFLVKGHVVFFTSVVVTHFTHHWTPVTRDSVTQINVIERTATYSCDLGRSAF
jgi:hypothetical protein